MEIVTEINGETAAADKASFWALKTQAAEHGIAPSLMGKLAALCSDYATATSILQNALATAEPRVFLAAIVRNLSRAPVIVSLARANQVPVEQVKLDDGSPGWKIGGAIYNAHGIDVGG